MQTTKFKCAACGKDFERSIRIECDLGVFQGCPHCGCWDFDKVTRDVMDKSELSQYLILARETARMGEKLGMLEAGGKQDTELYELYHNNRLRCMSQRMRIESFIFGIDDSFMRQILQYRYIDGLSWNAVAVRMGGYYSADYLRIAHDRFLRKTD